MALREEFTKQGDWLFRWRSYLPLGILPPAGLALFESARSPVTFAYPWEAVFTSACILFSFSGIVIRATAIGYSTKGTSGGNTKKQRADSLNTTGIYSVVRHPLYLGNWIIFTGILIFLRAWWFFIIGELLFLIYYERIMYCEEEFLSKKFGEHYDRWAGTTPAFIPKIKKWHSPEAPFSLWRVIKREYLGAFEIVVCFTLLASLKDFLTRGTFRLHTGWAVFFGTGFLFFGIVRILKAVTRARKRKGRKTG
jgi:protein-S-isoprenylcysteine O-methyltransferase Ste14